MNKKMFACSLVVFLVVSVVSSSQAVAEEKRGPYLDVIRMETRTSMETGIGDVAAGKLDMFLFPAPSKVYDGLPADKKEALNLIRSAAGYYSLIFNPVHDPGSKYVVTVDGEEFFNPLAIREVRFAMNWLIDRKYIVDQILGGSGAPMLGPVRSTHPAAPEFEEVYKQLGLTPEGDPAWAIQKINEELEKAAKELGGKLYKKEDPTSPAGYWWYYKDKPVTLTFLIRIEDERHEEGLYIANQIEKTGIKVDRKEWDRKKCIDTATQTQRTTSGAYTQKAG